MFTYPNNWDSLSPREKFALRLDAWQSTEGMDFQSGEAKANYEERLARLRNALELKGTDRPIANPGVGEYILRRAGLDGVDLLYNHERVFEPVIEFNKEFQPDLAISGFTYPGEVFDILGFQTYIWAGQKLPASGSIQCVEGEYMMADEYDEFIMDPSGFWLKKYIPRIFTALEPVKMLAHLPRISEIVDVGAAAVPFGMPPVREAMQALLDAGEAAMKWVSVAGKTGAALSAAGFPSMSTAFCKAPFDFLGDTLRGTRAIMLDLYRRPDKVIAACEAYVPILVKGITDAANERGATTCMFPLHKGADSFMSQEQFDKFYWPTLKAVMLGLWEEGISSYMFVEGAYNNRLETIAEMPEGSTCWWFDQTDMQKVHDILGDKFTIAGNVPASLMSTGSVEDLRAYCEDLCDLFQDHPGYLLQLGCGVEQTTDEHVRTFLDVVKQYA